MNQNINKLIQDYFTQMKDRCFVCKEYVTMLNIPHKLHKKQFICYVKEDKCVYYHCKSDNTYFALGKLPSVIYNSFHKVKE